jgi:hypothetical protein
MILDLPGFPAPQSPKDAERIFGTPTGKVRFQIEVTDLDTPLSAYQVFIAKECGREVNFLIEFPNNAAIFEDRISQPGKKVIYFQVLPAEVLVFSGTFTVRVLKNGHEILMRSLTVSPHPALP